MKMYVGVVGPMTTEDDSAVATAAEHSWFRDVSMVR